MDSETRRAIQALCEKLGHEWEEYKPSPLLHPTYKRRRCIICDKQKEIV